MTAPNPSPSSGNPAIDALAAAVSAETPTGSSTTSGDLYGLAGWGSQNVNPGDLPFLTAIIATGGHTTGDAVVKAFAAADPASIAEVQRALFLGGYYSTTYTPTYGVVKPEDVSAFGSAVTVAGQSKQAVSDVLLQGAQYGTVTGVAAARAQNTGRKAAVATVTLPNTADLEAQALAAFNTELGRNAKPGEAAAFAAAYRAMSAGMQRANNRASYDARYGGGVAGLSGKQARDLSGQAADVGTEQLTPYNGPNQDWMARGALITPGGAVVAPAQIPGNARLGPQIAAETGSQTPLVVIGGAGKPGAAYDPNAVSFSEQMASLGAVAQQAQTDATPSTSGGGLTQVEVNTPESPDVAAANYARNTNPQQAGAKDLADQFGNFLSILSGSFGGV